MSQKRNTAICLGFCTVLAACDSAPPTDPTTPGPSEAASDDVQSLSDSWAAKRSLSPYRYSMVAGTINGIIYVVGGVHTNWTTSRRLSRVDAYNVATDTWSQVASMPGVREAPNGASVINGKLYVTGGYNNLHTAEGLQKPTKTLFVYDPGTNSWARKADMPQPGCYGAQGVINGKLYVFMPPMRLCDPFADGDLVRFYRYNPATDTWVRRAVPPVPGEDLSGGAGGVINGKFYLAGRDSRLHVYDPTNNTWETRASMSEPRSDMVAAVLNGKLFLVGGQSGWSDVGPMPEFEVYNPLTDTWTLKTPLTFGTVWGAAVSAGGKIFYIAGRVYPPGPGGERLLDASEVYAYTP
jgi:N-acetylneuraminic acid mutarotase